MLSCRARKFWCRRWDTTIHQCFEGVQLRAADFFLQTLLSIISVPGQHYDQCMKLAVSGFSWICRSHPAVWGFKVTPTHNIYYLVGTVSAICWDGQNAINTRTTPEISYGYNFSLANGVGPNCANTTSPGVDGIDRPMEPQAIQIFGNGSWQYRLDFVWCDLFRRYTFSGITCECHV